MRIRSGFAAACLALATCPIAAGGAQAQQHDEFYRGKQIRLIVGNAAGADYDLGARLLARHMNRHIPGEPTVIVQNMPGAAGMVAANYISNVAPKDGTVFGSVSRNLPGQAVLGQKNLKVDPRRFNWLGSSGTNITVCYARAGSTIRTAEDVFTHELVVGGIISGSAQSVVPTVMNRVLNAKFRIIEGYKSTVDTFMAMERAEVDGMCSGYAQLRTAHASLLKEGKVRILLKSADAPLPDGPDVPSISSYAKQDKQKQILRFIFASDDFGRPYFAPAEIPPERLQVLRAAFRAALQDPALIAEAVKLQMDMSYGSPEALETFVRGLYSTPPELLAEIEKIMPAQ